MLLDEGSAPDYLRTRGVLPVGADARATPLGGGVSNVVILVESHGQRVVVKQSLPRLRVAQEWLAKRERIVTEGAALVLTGTLTPGAVPGVLDLDEDTLALTIEAAPREWRTWKELLLADEIDVSVAAHLGHVLARWHRKTAGSPEVRERFADHEAFEQLRVEPYYRTIQRAHPELAGRIGETIEAMLARRISLVHGDFSPKNVLVGEDGLWVIDHECAHVGDPAFDPAFLLTHLALKTIHRPGSAGDYAACAAAFLEAYDPAGIEADVTAHLGCLLLARVDGKSPAEYLNGTGREEARRLGIDLIRSGGSDPLAPWH